MNHLGIILSPVVESDDRFGGLDGRLAGRRFVAFESQGAFEIQFLLEIFVAQVLAPYFLRLVEVFWIGRFVSVEVVPVVAGKIELLGFEQLGDVSHVLLHSFRKSFEDHPCRADVACLGQIVQGRAILLELLEIGLKEVDMQAVKPFEVTVQKLR